MFELQLDRLGEHVRNVIWESLGTELGLTTCQQGCPEHLRTPDDLAEVVPAVLIDPPKWGGATPHKVYPALEGTVTLGITYLRAIEADEEHPRATVQLLQKIAGLFSQPGFELAGWDGDSDGFEVEQIWPADVGHEHDLTYEDSSVRIALGSITLLAKVNAYNPVG